MAETTPYEQHRRTFDALIDAVDEVILATHVQPDGDALGSEIRLYSGARGPEASTSIRATTGVAHSRCSRAGPIPISCCSM